MQAMQLPVPSATAQGRKLMLFTMGSRGDIQPMIALASALQEAGFRVCVGTNSNHVSFVEGFDLEAIGIGMDLEAFMKADSEVRSSMATGNISKFMDGVSSENKRHFPANMAKKINAVRGFKPDVILCTPLDMYEVSAIAGVLAIPVIFVALQICFPSKGQQSMIGEPSWAPHRLPGYLVWHSIFSAERDGKASVVLDQLPEGKPWLMSTFEQFMALAHHPTAPLLIGFSPLLYSPKSDWTEEVKESVNFTGFWVVDKKEQTARFRAGDSTFGGDALQSLSDFLRKGESPPVYMGWGSMLAVSSEHMACLAVRSLMQAKQRGIILGGWAELDAEKLKGQADSELLEAYAKDNVLFVKTAPHEWLFPQCSVIVHHGGSGTTAAALRAGIPTVVTPCFCDQFDNAQLVAGNGVGIALKQFAKVTPKALSGALTKCMSDRSMQERSRALGQQLLKEDGLGNAVRIVENFITEELDTGRWKATFEQRNKQFRVLQARAPPGCLAWIARLLCSFEPNRFLPRLPKLSTADRVSSPSRRGQRGGA